MFLPLSRKMVLWLVVLCLQPFHPLLANPMDANAIIRDIGRQNYQDQMLRQTLRFGWTEDEFSAPLMAFVEVFPRKGLALKGFGEVRIHLKSKQKNLNHKQTSKRTEHPEEDGPDYAFVELNGQRYFPKDTDSIRVWGLLGIPYSEHWVFLVARGKINAYSQHPGLPPRYYGIGSVTDTPIPKSVKAVFGHDSLLQLLIHYPRAWAEANENPLLAVHLFNSVSELETQSRSEGRIMHLQILQDRSLPIAELSHALQKNPNDYLARLGRARHLCRKKNFSDAEKDLDIAKSIDSSYYLLHWTQAYCEEKQEHPALQLHQLHQAEMFAPSSWSNLKKARSLIIDLEKTQPTDSQYWREIKKKRPRNDRLGPLF